MALAAVMASGASAAETPVETENTAYTCIEGAGEHNTNADCTPGSSGTFGHVAIPENLSTGITIDKVTNPKLETKIGLVNVVLTGTGAIECNGCMAENQTDPETGKMDVTGSGGRIVFHGVQISVKGCKVTNEEFEAEPLRLTTLSPTKAALTPVNPPTMALINVEDNGAEHCPLASLIEIRGHAGAEVHGATVIFTATSSAMTVGTGAAALRLVWEATATAGETGGAYHPVALT
jgi:hypothetical protein